MEAASERVPNCGEFFVIEALVLRAAPHWR